MHDDHMWLRFLEPNMAWVFFLGGTMTTMGNRRFFPTRHDALHAAHLRGLDVQNDGMVITLAAVDSVDALLASL